MFPQVHWDYDKSFSFNNSKWYHESFALLRYDMNRILIRKFFQNAYISSILADEQARRGTHSILFHVHVNPPPSVWSRSKSQHRWTLLQERDLKFYSFMIATIVPTVSNKSPVYDWQEVTLNEKSLKIFIFYYKEINRCFYTLSTKLVCR